MSNDKNDKKQIQTERRRHLRGNNVISNNMLWALGTGLIPIPVVDTSATIAIQLKMLAELSDVYEVPFSYNSGKSVVASLLTSLTANLMGKSLVGSGLFYGIARMVPVLGYGLKALTMPVFTAAFTYALGKVFQQHFAAGGTILTFDPKKTDSYFREKFDEGKKVVAEKYSPKAA
ncbi:YcjF family protein [Thalassospira sp.]|uniref:YcjF family protein n=1 Tax=Thalassospira sp. TaxID=1912094 RepID=UPI002735A6DC|nr:DUF697 domain-containing protein [Thalassospira sp.]MDP2699976.1 DUF697 domain-containing protein [Thalassospira sp.]